MEMYHFCSVEPLKIQSRKECFLIKDQRFHVESSLFIQYILKERLKNLVPGR